jgi:hypothetical protein
MSKMDIAESGRIELFFGKYLRSNHHQNPLKVVLWVMLFAYIPLIIITAIEGSLFKGSVDIPFTLDYYSQFRALLAIPLLIIGRRLVNEKLFETNNYVANTLLNEEEYLTVLAPTLGKIKRLNEKGYDELVIIISLIVYTTLISYYNISKIGILDRSNWLGEIVDGEIQFTTAAKWQLFVSLNIYRFIILRWIWMYGCWVWILIKISKCKLQLAVHHADKVCGLNLLMLPQRAFNMFFVALAVIASGNLINQIVYFNESLDAVKMEMCIVIGASFIFLLAPYLRFTKLLLKAKREAEVLMSRKSAELSRSYEEQFIENNGERNTEAKIDASAMADFNATYDIVLNIKPVPFSVRDVIGLAIPVVLAFVPTLLSFMTLKELLDIVLGFIA